jgi:hypothetical protein
MDILHMEHRFKAEIKLEEDKTLVLRTHHQDDDVSELNQSLRNSGLLRPGRNSAPLHPDGAEMIYWFQADQHAWAVHKKRFPFLHQDLHSKDQLRREAAAAEIARQHPEWLVCAPKLRVVGQT